MNIQNAAPSATFVGWSNIPRIISQTLPHDKKWKVFVQSLPFFQIIHTFSIFTKYIYQEFNENNVLKLQENQFLSNFMPYNFECDLLWGESWD